MFKNNLYNLMMQLTVEHTSLWRIKKEYMKDAKGDAKATAFWKKMAKDKEMHIKELHELVKKNMK
ncbi:hypothetical protein KC842_00435 [Candidatus Nomurabacteria bacterium]|nr:hypothetical protein [Candidatus Nomurabacteria bacterium]USN94808.1 MAG: hypothetical protein H6791_00020 [Candidatus Nomurabacteria bacterium]